MHISIEGMDGVGKTTVCKLLSKKLNIKFIEKPLKYLFDENGKDANYIRIRNKVNLSENRVFTSWFYSLSNIYLYEKYSNKNIITDRHIVSNYAWSGTENNCDVYDLLIKKIGTPTLTVILYATKEVIKDRLIGRNQCDKDIKRLKYTEQIYERMISFCEDRCLRYIIIDTSKKTPDEITRIVEKNLEKINA